MWRPENWSNPYSLKYFPNYDDLDGDMQERIMVRYWLYETGADAMLKALRESSVADILVRDNESIRIAIGDLGKYGWKAGEWLFIPDE